MPQVAIENIAARALSALATAENVPSPCVSVCRMDATSGWCTGCYRTLDEIALWGMSDDTEKRRIWRAILERLPAKP